jgi:hypothetical protein
MSSLIWFFTGHKGSGPESKSASLADFDGDAWLWNSTTPVNWNSTTQMDY